MSSILSDIFAGDYHPTERPCRPNTPVSIKFREMERLADAIQRKLPDELLAEFKQFRDAQADFSFYDREEEFIEGFRLGVKLMIAALCPETE